MIKRYTYEMERGTRGWRYEIYRNGESILAGARTGTKIECKEHLDKIVRRLNLEISGSYLLRRTAAVGRKRRAAP